MGSVGTARWRGMAAVLSLVGSVWALASPAPAAAVQTFGSNLVATPNVTSGGSPLTTTHGALPPSSRAPGGVTSPIDGVIVRWRIKNGAFTLPLTPRVIRPGASLTATAAGTGETVTPPVSATTTYETRLPVRAGDGLGIDFDGSTGSLSARADIVGATEFNYIPQLTDGGPPVTGFPINQTEDLWNADVEPDADGDGFGDESQDCDPSSAAKRTDCAPPDAALTSGPKPKTRKKIASFTFTGTDARAVERFECSLDAGPFTTCTSPFTIKVKRGRHTLSVRAVDDSTNVDPTPASYAWKVKRKKRKKK